MRRGPPENPPERWTEEEAKRLRQLRLDGLTRKQIANKLGRPFGSIQGKIYRMELPKHESTGDWTKEEEEILRRDWEKALPVKIIKGKLPNRTLRAVRQKAWRLGIGPHPTFRHRKFKWR